MALTDLVAPNAIIPALKVNNKKQVLLELAARAAALTGQNERAIFEILMQREKLGSTAVGNGIAIPHGKMPNSHAAVRTVRAARPADRFRSARRPAGRSHFSVAGAGRRGRRSFQGAGAGGAAASRSLDRPQTARLAGRRSALRGAGDAVGDRSVAGAKKRPQKGPQTRPFFAGAFLHPLRCGRRRHRQNRVKRFAVPRGS